MRKICVILLGLVCVLCLFQDTARPKANQSKSTAQEPHRSPIDIALVGESRFALVANHTADSVSLVDIDEGKVLAEEPCGRKPVAVAVFADGQHAAVSNLLSGSLTLLAIRGALPTPGKSAGIEKIRDVPVGTFPRGLVFSRDGKSLFVALAGQDEVIRLDWASLKVMERWLAPREPRHLALSGDGRWLAAASSQSGQIRCWNVETGKLHWQREIGDAFNLRGLAFTLGGDAVICAHCVRRDFPVTKTNIEEGWVIDSRLTRLAAAPTPSASARMQTKRAAVSQIALDERGRAVGDPCGVAFASAGRTLALTASGTHELLLLDTQAIPWTTGDPGDFLDNHLEKNDKFRRIPLGGRPMALAVRGQAPVAVVANYLLDSVQVVDIQTGKIARTIPLGSPRAPASARQGEALFYDARRSHDQWFSCHTCHVDGHTCGLNFDTLNDDTYGTPKLTPSLYNVTRTGPWTWHGRQKNLGDLVVKSFTTTMFGAEPTQKEIAAMLAFLETLAPPPRPSLGAATDRERLRRGESLFNDKAHCSRCHRAPYYTSPAVYDVHLEAEGSLYKLWNPPSLLGLYDRGPYLHDGRAKTLDEVLQKYHTPEMLGGKKLTDDERSDLKAFLLAL